MKLLPVRARRCLFMVAVLASMFARGVAVNAQSNPATAIITDLGAVGDGKTLNTERIQSAINGLAAKGGGTVVVPAGVFLSGALFLKPGVNLRLDKDATLRCTTDMKEFRAQRTRIEGHFEESFNPALINARGCDGLRISGEGTLDGAGRPIWDQFWKLRNAAPDRNNFKNLSVPRARLCLIEQSRNVVIDGITFKDSQFWNLHLYRCIDATVQNARFEVPDDYKQAPSTDGIDVDSCQGVTIKGCYFSVTDDCIAAKGTKGPQALEDKDSPPVERLRISDCTFKRGGGVLTCGSEATVVRDVIVENCRVPGSMSVLLCKLRADTPQTYENIQCRHITVDNPGGAVLTIAPWKQYFDLKGQPPPKSTVRNITMTDITGQTKVLAAIAPNPGQTEISDITLRNVDVQVKEEKVKVSGVKNFKAENVNINGKPFTP